MYQLVERLLTLARLDAGVDHVTLRFGTVDLAPYERFAAEVLPAFATRRATRFPPATTSSTARGKGW